MLFLQRKNPPCAHRRPHARGPGCQRGEKPGEKIRKPLFGSRVLQEAPLYSLFVDHFSRGVVPRRREEGGGWGVAGRPEDWNVFGMFMPSILLLYLYISLLVIIYIYIYIFVINIYYYFLLLIVIIIIIIIIYYYFFLLFITIIYYYFFAIITIIYKALSSSPSRCALAKHRRRFPARTCRPRVLWCTKRSVVIRRLPLSPCSRCAWILFLFYFLFNFLLFSFFYLIFLGPNIKKNKIINN